MSSDQELPPAENGTTTKDSSTVTNELETGSKPDSSSSVPQVQNDTSSQNSSLPPNEGVNKPKEDDTGTLKQSSASHEIKPAENETSKDSDNTSQAAETSKKEPDHTENVKKDAEDDNTFTIPCPPDDNPARASSINKQEAGGTKTSSQDSDPNVQEIPPAQVEIVSQKPLPPVDNVSQTTEIRSQETEDTEASRRDSTTSADPSVQQIPPAQDENAPQNQLPREDNVSQTTEIRSPETEDNEASRQDSATSADPQSVDTAPAENETISKESSPPQVDVTQSTQTRNQEIDAIEDHSREQDVTPSENEATARHASSPKNILTESVTTSTPDTVPNHDIATKDTDFRPPVNEISPEGNVNTVKCSSLLPTGPGHVADSRPKKSSRCTFPFLFKRRKDSSPKTFSVSQTTKSETSTTSSSEVNALPNLIQADINSVAKETLALLKYNERLMGLNEDAQKEFAENQGNHGELRKSMIKLKLLIPSQSNVDSDAFKDLQLRLKARKSIPPDVLEKMPRLHKNDIFYRSPEIKDFEVLYEMLKPSKLKICLLCFSIFPSRHFLASALSSQNEL